MGFSCKCACNCNLNCSRSLSFAFRASPYHYIHNINENEILYMWSVKCHGKAKPYIIQLYIITIEILLLALIGSIDEKSLHHIMVGWKEPRHTSTWTKEKHWHAKGTDITYIRTDNNERLFVAMNNKERRNYTRLFVCSFIRWLVGWLVDSFARCL